MQGLDSQGDRQGPAKDWKEHLSLQKDKETYEKTARPISSSIFAALSEQQQQTPPDQLF